MKKVYGSYLNDAEARSAMSHLFEEGYTREEIKLISNKDSDGNLNYSGEKKHESFWDKVKETFTPGEHHENSIERNLNDDERQELAKYESNLQAGEVILLVEERAGTPGGVYHRDLDNDEKTMELKKEQLNVDKENVQTREVDVKKVVKKETETIEVPVEKEELVIERKSADHREVKDGEKLDTDHLKSEEEIHIPLKEERVNVSKDTVVDDEVVISKDKHKESRLITEDVKHEDIEVEGDSALNKGLKDKNRRSKDI